MSPSWMPMPSARNRLCNAGLLVLAYALLAIGCDGVQEGRHIEFSPSGNQVAFQHGNDGLFVADPQTGKLQKVFDPDPSIVAVSTPIWADDESAAIFTTARVEQPAKPAAKAANAKGPAVPSAAQSTSFSTPADWNDSPEGRIFFCAARRLHVLARRTARQRTAQEADLAVRGTLQSLRLCGGQSGRPLALAPKIHSLRGSRIDRLACGLVVQPREKIERPASFRLSVRSPRLTSSATSCRTAITLPASPRNRIGATYRPSSRAKSKPTAWPESGSARATARIGGTSPNRSRPGKTILRSGSPI